MKARCLTLSLLLATPLVEAGEGHSVTAQGFKEVIEKSVLEKEKDWQLERSEAREKADARGVPGVVLRWMPKKGVEILSASDRRTRHPYPDVGVQIHMYDSGEKASEVLRFMVDGTSMGPAGVVKELGDEAWVWTGDSPYGGTWVRVRTGRILIVAHGPLLDVTMRFAELAKWKRNS
jgi:hypothetical protein